MPPPAAGGDRRHCIGGMVGSQARRVASVISVQADRIVVASRHRSGTITSLLRCWAGSSKGGESRRRQRLGGRRSNRVVPGVLPSSKAPAAAGGAAEVLVSKTITVDATPLCPPPNTVYARRRCHSLPRNASACRQTGVRSFRVTVSTCRRHRRHGHRRRHPGQSRSETRAVPSSPGAKAIMARVNDASAPARSQVVVRIRPTCREATGCGEPGGGQPAVNDTGYAAPTTGGQRRHEHGRPGKNTVRSTSITDGNVIRRGSTSGQEQRTKGSERVSLEAPAAISR